MIKTFFKWLLRRQHEEEIRRRIMAYTRNCYIHEHILIFSLKTTQQEDREIFEYLRRKHVLQQYQILYLSDHEFKKIIRDPQRTRKYLK